MARDLGIGEQMLGRWVKARRLQRGLDKSPQLSLEEKAEVKELRRRVKGLEEKLAFLKKQSPSSSRSIGNRALRADIYGEG